MISIHALHTECDSSCYSAGPGDISISIHALHTECDYVRSFRSASIVISIHALHTECDGKLEHSSTNSLVFQSTHSIRSATFSVSLLGSSLSYFNPRTPYGVRLVRGCYWPPRWDFNPRTPYGVRLLPSLTLAQGALISIHALHTECDVIINGFVEVFRYFNPRTPYGVRPCAVGLPWYKALFQSTHSIRSATAMCSPFMPQIS